MFRHFKWINLLWRRYYGTISTKKTNRPNGNLIATMYINKYTKSDRTVNQW